MDLTQRKLNKSEWISIETPVSDEQKEVLRLIINAYHNVNLKYNKNKSLITFLKVENNDVMEDYLYIKYFSKIVSDIQKKCKCNNNVFSINIKSTPKIKKADLIRLEKNNILKISGVYELLLLDNVEKIFEYKDDKDNIYKNNKNKKWLFYYFTLYKLNNNTVEKINKHVKQIINAVLTLFEDELDLVDVIKNGVEYIEKNELLLKHADMMLYEHQKEIFTIMKNPTFEQKMEQFRIYNDCIDCTDVSIKSKPKLILYIAPTGTGKTLTPIGLSERFRVIFVCAARHIGLALAKSAISMNKKIAFAFGCSSADDIRLHYFAAKEFKTNKKSGGIGKVDNSIGDKVEIIICDVKSYLCAMFYMMAFNPLSNILTYWDEPTISLDYEKHELHEYIHKNWTENLIPNLVLSSATLPKIHEIPDTNNHFIQKFPGAEVYSIISHDCRKSIPIINKNGYIVIPHLLSQDYSRISIIVNHCKENLTLLRYFDLNKVIEFIIFIEQHGYSTNRNKIGRHFTSLFDVTMQNIKMFYINLLGQINEEEWIVIYNEINKLDVKFIDPNNRIDEKGILIKKSFSIGPGIKLSSTNNVVDGQLGKTLVKMLSVQLLEEDKTRFQQFNTIPDLDPLKLDPFNQIKQIKNDHFAIYVSTKDAYTLTDGPTIFLAEDVNKIAKFYIQQANIPQKAMDQILEKSNIIIN